MVFLLGFPSYDLTSMSHFLGWAVALCPFPASQSAAGLWPGEGTNRGSHLNKDTEPRASFFIFGEIHSQDESLVTRGCPSPDAHQSPLLGETLNITTLNITAQVFSLGRCWSVGFPALGGHWAGLISDPPSWWSIQCCFILCLIVSRG